MKKSNFGILLTSLGCFSLIALAGAPITAAAQNSLDKDRPEAAERINSATRQWISDSMKFHENKDGNLKLLLRRAPVKFFLSIPFGSVADEAAVLIGSLSRAIRVSFDYATREPNLIIVVDTPIANGDQPNPAIWQKFNLPREALKTIAERGGLSSGCGNYSFRDPDGQISLSIVLADSAIGEESIRSCVVEGVISSFGLRHNRKYSIRPDDGYLQYVLLLRSIGDCETQYGSKIFAANDAEGLRLRYTDCLVSRLTIK